MTRPPPRRPSWRPQPSSSRSHFASSRRREQPSIDDPPRTSALTPTRLEPVCQRWAGLTTAASCSRSPSNTCGSCCGIRRRRSTRHVRPVFPAPAASRDGFAIHEALAPRDRRGDGLVLRCGFHPSPFGQAVVFSPLRTRSLHEGPVGWRPLCILGALCGGPSRSLAGRVPVRTLNAREQPSDGAQRQAPTLTFTFSRPRYRGSNVSLPMVRAAHEPRPSEQSASRATRPRSRPT